MALAVLVLALGATLYILPYILGVQLTAIDDPTAQSLANALVSSHNLPLAMPLCYLSGALAGILGLVAVAYNLRQAGGRPARSQA